VTGTSDPFVDLLTATINSTRNYHRLAQCSYVEGAGSRSTFLFKEETITDLLVGEFAGKEYKVEAECPACADGPNSGGSCPDWDGDSESGGRRLHIRALTKQEEGGNRRYRKLGVHADFILAVRRQAPGSDSRGPRLRELRIMVQAKRVFSNKSTFTLKPPYQYGGLIEAAQKYGAVPYYAVYLQQPSAHHSTPTACCSSLLTLLLIPALCPAVRLRRSSATGILCDAWPTVPVLKCW
jgi:hypothetical protein